MESLLEDINGNLNFFVNQLFDDATMDLVLFKKLKNKDIMKPQFNINFVMDGLDYESLHPLSGGEKSRISFCLTLALNTVVKSPFILLDECTSSMESELREKCIEILREHFNDVKVVEVCHETIEGYYDHVIPIDG